MSIKKNDHIFIISGASKWMVKKILKEIGLVDLVVIASREKYFMSGMLAREHCYSSNKVSMFEELVGQSAFLELTGYSDSSADIPMLSLCDKRVIINPKKHCLAKFKKAFSDDFIVTHWN